MEKFKTINENKVTTEIGYTTIGLEKQLTLIKVLNNLDKAVLSLDRYNFMGEDWCGDLVKSEDGVWVNINDVLNLFRGKKD